MHADPRINQAILREQLAEAERLAEQNERELARQREIVAELVQRGQRCAEIAELARELLKELQQRQLQLLAEREEFAEINSSMRRLPGRRRIPS